MEVVEGVEFGGEGAGGVGGVGGGDGFGFGIHVEGEEGEGFFVGHGGRKRAGCCVVGFRGGFGLLLSRAVCGLLCVVLGQVVMLAQMN